MVAQAISSDFRDVHLFDPRSPCVHDPRRPPILLLLLHNSTDSSITIRRQQRLKIWREDEGFSWRVRARVWEGKAVDPRFLRTGYSEE